MVEENPAADGPNPEIRLDEAKSQVDRAMAMLERNDFDDALAILANLEEALRYAKDTDLRIQWARCLNGLGFIELMDAKEARAATIGVTADTEAEAEGLKDFQRGLRLAMAHFEQALAVQADDAYRRYVLGNKAYCLALLGRDDEARKAFSHLFADGDRSVYDGQIADTGRLRIPEDGAIIRLIEDVWDLSVSKD